MAPSREERQQHLQSIDNLRQGFSVPLLDGGAACARLLLPDAMAFEGGSDWWKGVRDIRLASAVGQLAQQLAAVAQPTADALEAAAAAGDAEACEALLLYAQAALFAASFCAAAARSGQWGQWPAARNDLFRVLTAAKVAMIAGQRSLLVQMVQLSHSQRDASSPAAPAVVLRRARLMDAAAVQLGVMQVTMGQLASPFVGGQLAATFASAVAPPQLLLPWMTTMRQAFSEACAHGVGDHDPIREFVEPFSGLLAFTVGESVYARHQQELAAPQSILQRQALADAALSCLLLLADAAEQHFGAGSSAGGSTPIEGGSSGCSSGSGGEAADQAGSSGATRTCSSSGSGGEAAEYGGRIVSALTMLQQALDAAIVQQGFVEVALTIDELVNGLKAGARMALALPLDETQEVPQAMLSLAHLAAAQCMSTTANALLDRPQMAAVWEQRNSGSRASQQPAAEEAGWLALRVLPRLAVALPRLAAAPPGDGIIDGLVGQHNSAMQLPHLIGEFRTVDEAVQWATAAEAALRLLPLLASLDAQAVQQGRRAGGLQQAAGGGWAAGGGEESNAAELAGHLVNHVWHGGAARLSRFVKRYITGLQQSGEGSTHGQQQQGQAQSGDGGSEPQGSSSVAQAPPELTLQLLRLHMTACRLFALGSAAPAPMQRWWLEKCTKLAAGLNVVLSILQIFLVEFGDGDPLSERRYAGAHSAHSVALEPILEAIEALPSGDRLKLSVHGLVIDAIGAVRPPTWSLLNSDAWMARLCYTLEALTADGSLSPEGRLLAIIQAMPGLSSKARLVARLAASGALAAACRQFVRLGHICDAARTLIPVAFTMLQAAQEELLLIARDMEGSSPSLPAEAAAGSGAAEQLGAVDREELGAAIARLQDSYDALSACEAAGPDGLSLDTLADMYVPAAEAAAWVGTLLLQAWATPEQQAAQQLELAQAAATRSCAYLRCANLGGEGGPFAGQGVDSKRCSACRAVWYCGTACSHADWRAGHKRMCKALTAARQAEREAARQQQG